MAVAVLGITGCGHDKGSSPTPSVSPIASTPPSPSPKPLALPDLIDGTTVLGEVPPTKGNRAIDTITPKAGVLWVSFACQGDGELAVSVGAAGKFTHPCKTDSADPERNGIEVTATPLDVEVIAPQTLRWSLRIQQ